MALRHITLHYRLSKGSVIVLRSVASPGFVARGKLKIRSWGTHGELQGRVQQLLDDYSFVTNAVLIERAVSC